MNAQKESELSRIQSSVGKVHMRLSVSGVLVGGAIEGSGAMPDGKRKDRRAAVEETRVITLNNIGC